MPNVYFSFFTTVFSFQGAVFIFFFLLNQEYSFDILSYFMISVKVFFVSWWRRRDSNSWPPACKAGALPTELRPHVTGKLVRKTKTLEVCGFYHYLQLYCFIKLVLCFIELFVVKAILLVLGLPVQLTAVQLLMVGSSGLEPPTSRLSGVRSNQLSYEPIFNEILAATYSPGQSPAKYHRPSMA